MHLLFFLTNFGDPFLTVPLAAAVLCWFAGTRQWRAAFCWTGGFACGTGAVALTKFAYAGWGIGIAALHFTGISGHTMLSAAVYPLVGAICASRAGQTAARYGARAGLAFAFAIGTSRVLFGFHSISEIVSGWLLGAGVGAATLRVVTLAREAAVPLNGGERNGLANGRRHADIPPRAGRKRDPRATLPPRGTAPFTAAVVVIVLLCHGRIAPLSDWIANAAPKLSEWSGTLHENVR